MKLLKKILPLLKNKYIFASLLFFIWLLFFDRNDLISQVSLRMQFNRMKQDRLYYMQEIENNNRMMRELVTNPSTLEKFAREKYLMKKDNEEVFLLVRSQKE